MQLILNELIKIQRYLSGKVVCQKKFQDKSLFAKWKMKKYLSFLFPERFVKRYLK